MSKKRTTAAAAKPAVPQLVRLRCERTGKEKDFTPAHAAALLQYQQERGLTDWQPVTAADSPTA